MAIDLSRVKGLCFDVDGTISDTDDVYVSRLTRMFSPISFLFSERNPKPFARWLVMVTESPLNGIYHLADTLSVDDEFARIYNWMSQKRKSQRTFQIMQGTCALLDLVKTKYPLTVVTARDAVSTRRFLDQFELNGYFRDVVSSLTCEFTKPYPHPVLYAAQAMGVEAESCIMIGDTTVDILAGKAAGAQTIGVLCGFGTEKELKKAGADLIIRNLDELAAFFAENPLTSA